MNCIINKMLITDLREKLVEDSLYECIALTNTEKQKRSERC